LLYQIRLFDTCNKENTIQYCQDSIKDAKRYTLFITAFDSHVISVYNSVISRSLEVEIRKKFQRNPEQYLDMSNGPDGIKDLRSVFSSSGKYALILFGAKPILVQKCVFELPEISF
jgi:hypothetical protein